MSKIWRRGELFMTANTKRWSEESICQSNEEEKTMVFSNFRNSDQGKSRELICTLNTNNKDYEYNANLISAAPELLEACQEFVRKVECGEARSTRSYLQMKSAINKALK